MEKQTKQHVLCVISHTHWDREWYMPLEQMRLRLVDLIDRCLALLEREPTYIFHLDAQTVVLEDYLAIRCDRRERSARMIADGRLSVGPWYLQNDFYLTSGEATVRDLLEGTRLAESFGAADTAAMRRISSVRSRSCRRSCTASGSTISSSGAAAPVWWSSRTARAAARCCRASSSGKVRTAAACWRST